MTAIPGWTAPDGAGASVPAQEDPGKIVVDLGGVVKMEFARIEAGKFLMGSGEEQDGKPVHEVTISRDYWLQTTETTQGQWELVMGVNPSHVKGADLPVEQVSWGDCHDFLKRLNEKADRQLEGRKATLPTEAQWEYACRAGGKGKWCFGDDEKKLGEYAWHQKDSNFETNPVGRKKPNAWGLYDMHGNVWEWCEDWYEKGYAPEAVTDPTGPEKGAYRCVRGVYWEVVGSCAGSATRFRVPPKARVDTIGLRVALRR